MTMHGSLPPRLTSAENLQLLKLTQEGDDEARAKVIEHNLRLAAHVTKKYENTGLGFEDLFSIATIGLLKAVDSFKVEKAVQFATYASTCMSNEILMFLRRNKRHKSLKSMEDVLTKDFEGNELKLEDLIRDESIESFEMAFINADDKSDMRHAMMKLNDKEKQVIEFRFFKGLTQKETGQAMKISQSYVTRLEAKAVERMRTIIAEKNAKAEKPKNNVIPFKTKEERKMSKGDTSKAIRMLRTTDVDISVISTATGCTLSKVNELAETYRPRESEDDIKIRRLKERHPGKYAGMKVRDNKEWRAIGLLEDTYLTYGEIVEQTGTDYARISRFGRAARSEEKRNKIKSDNAKIIALTNPNKAKRPRTGDTDRALQLMLKGGYKYSQISQITGVPAGSLTGLRKEYEAGDYEWQDPAILEAVLGQKETSMSIAMKEAIDKSRVPRELRNPQKLPVMNKPVVEVKTQDVPTPAKSITEAVEEFKNEIIDEYKAKIEEETKMAETSNATQTSQEEGTGKVKRSFSFNFEAFGDKVSVQEFLDELEGIKAMVTEGKVKDVTFTLNVEATK